MVRSTPRNTGYTLTRRSKHKHKRTHHHHHGPHPARTIVTRRQSHISGSFFHMLPPEVFDMILDKLSVLEMSMFSMVSKEITGCVVDYISTVAWKNRTIVQNFHHSTCLERRSTIGHYRDLGVRWHKELQLRLFCRQVLLDPWQNQPDSQFWLMQLLKPWPMVSQARLLFILYGPLLPEGSLGWQDLVERGLPHSALWDLSKAILLLFDEVGVKDSVIQAILEELIVIPQPWHLENVARLLVLCGSSLCYTILASKAINGRLREISRLIVYIIMVCEKDGYHMSWAVKLVQQICKIFNTAPERFFFIQELENMFSEVTRDVFEFSVAGNHFGDGETFQTLCSLLNSSARFHTTFLHMLLK
ncbi:F-box only protein 47 [Collichthys lucidus]|uniref:F-box only protein 47 n=1 Tax=Collichthys lucidus TaxID=240159 RepID=A0A4U5U093_COLLU|nr:F-box only protein 47 [Collichthys lucidus]